MSNINNNNLKKSTKLKSPEEDIQIDEILVEQPEHLEDALLKNDFINNSENEIKDENNKAIIEKEKKEKK